MSRSLFQLIFAFFRYFYSYFLNWQESWPSISKPARSYFWAGQNSRQLQYFWAGKNYLLIFLSWQELSTSIFELARIRSSYFWAGNSISSHCIYELESYLFLRNAHFWARILSKLSTLWQLNFNAECCRGQKPGAVPDSAESSCILLQHNLQ